MLVKNLQNIKEKITISAEKDNRSLNDIKLVAVTKNVPIEKIKDIIDLGITDIGENRIQEAQDKFNQLQSENYKIGQYKWHMIGHLQTNKAKYA
ncbi:MAG: YggS family pyridoxal phosphate-dependent enzyme, partial [Elusimicrobia bacterium CG02_land_8_20_14_3_00_37_13]